MPKVHKKSTSMGKDRGASLREAVMSEVYMGHPCRACKFSKEDLALVVEMRENGVPFTAISRGFAKLGIHVSDQTLTRHFRTGHNAK